MIKITNEKVISGGSVIVITGVNNSIEIECNEYPKEMVIFGYINNCPYANPFPLVYSHDTDNGYIFKGNVILNRKTIDYMGSNTNKVYTISFSVGLTNIEGSIPFVINYDSISRVVNSLPDNYDSLLYSINSVSTKLSAYISGKFSNEPINTNCNIQKGMSPIAIDNSGNYVWDYPFVKEKEYLKNIANTLVDISNQISTLNKRLSDLENKLTTHMYQEYE